MKPKTLTLLVIICGVLAWLGLREDGPKRQVRGFKNATPFKNLDFNSIDDVLIVKGEDRLHLQLKEDHWKAITGELTFNAEFSNIRKLLLEIRDVEWLRQPAVDDRHDVNFGLDKDAQPGRLELKSNGKVLLGLSLGKGIESNQPSPFGFQPEQGQHVRVDGTPGVFYAKDRLGISVSPGEWINKVLAKADVNDIDAIELSSLGHQLVFTKDVIERKDKDGKLLQKDDLWKASGTIPEGINLLPTRVTKWLSELNEIQVQEPVDLAIRKDFPSKAEHTITVKKGDETIYSIEAQNLEEDWYLWEKGDTTRLFKASKYVAEDLFHKKSNLFNLDAHKISLSGNLTSLSWQNSTTEFSRDGENWNVVGEGTHPELNAETFASLKGSLLNTKVSNFLPGLKRTSLNRLTVKGENSELTLEDCGISPFDNTRLVRKGEVIYTIPQVSYEKLFPKTEALMAEYSPAASIYDLSSITLPRCKLTKEDNGNWKCDDLEGKVSSIIQWLNQLRLVFKSDYHPNGAIGTVTANIELVTKEDKTYTLQLGESKKGKTPVKFSAFSGTFMISMDLARSLNNGKGYFVDNSNALKGGSTTENKPKESLPIAP